MLQDYTYSWPQTTQVTRKAVCLVYSYSDMSDTGILHRYMVVYRSFYRHNQVFNTLLEGHPCVQQPARLFLPQFKVSQVDYVEQQLFWDCLLMTISQLGQDPELSEKGRKRRSIREKEGGIKMIQSTKGGRGKIELTVKIVWLRVSE